MLIGIGHEIERLLIEQARHHGQFHGSDFAG